MKRKVAIQGIMGCNHHIAALNYFENDTVETVDCSTFRELSQAVLKEPDTLGIMAVENTIAGSILQNYQIIRESGLKVIGEYKLRIEHALVALPGVNLHDIKEINSHPMALMQCEDFLNTLPNVKLVEKDDTAGSAKWIKDNNLKDHAAICPPGAAKMYGMEIIAEGIETNKRNFTRFLILSSKEVYNKEEYKDEINKSFIVFTLPHVSGSLSKVLSILSFYDMNLSMIQSFPIIGKEWEYQFYINLLFTDYEMYKKALDAIMPLTKEFKILGEYSEGNLWK